MVQSRRLQRSVLLMTIVAAVAVPAMAQDKKLVLRVADQFPQGHFMLRYAIKPWMEQVTKATGGEVQFEHYPGEQLGKAKDFLSLVQSGVADIVLLAPAYVSDKMPLTAVMELPGLFENSCQGNAAYWKLAREGGLLAQKEYAPNGVRALFSTMYPPYQLVSAKRKIDTPKHVEGMKLRVLSRAMDLAVSKLKGVGVRMTSPEIFEAMSRGTIDGAILSYGVAANYNVPARYVTVGESFGSAAMLFVIGESRWAKLPDHVKKAMAEAGEMANRNVCAEIDKEEAGELENLKKKGVTAVRWSASDRTEVESMLMSVANEWAVEMDKRGKPGGETLKAALAARSSR